MEKAGSSLSDDEKGHLVSLNPPQVQRKQEALQMMRKNIWGPRNRQAYGPSCDIPANQPAKNTYKAVSNL
jgi:hypothetical protein